MNNIKKGLMLAALICGVTPFKSLKETALIWLNSGATSQNDESRAYIYQNNIPYHKKHTAPYANKS